MSKHHRLHIVIYNYDVFELHILFDTGYIHMTFSYMDFMELCHLYKYWFQHRYNHNLERYKEDL
jgi:hypothetical protein